MNPFETATDAIARAFLAEGDWTAEALAERAGRVLGIGRRIWVHRLAGDIVRCFPLPPRPRVAKLADVVSWHSGFRRAFARRLSRGGFATNRLAIGGFGMSSHPALPGTGNLPAFRTPDELAAWLGLSLGRLDWLADVHGRERTRPRERLRHYRYRWIAKSRGRARLLESPKPLLCELQRLLLNEIVGRIPPHAAACGFRRGRSIRDFVAPHAGRRVALTIDLRNFFPTVRASRVNALFRTFGYPEEVARRLTGLCTNSVPNEVLAASPHRRDDKRDLYEFRDPHLPQGAPTSPALANLAAYRLDVRLAALAKRTGARYTRYADDLLFSGDREFERMLPTFRVWVCTIAILEGFAIRERKTRVMLRFGRQRAAGVVFNESPNVVRAEFDRLKATLHNCGRHGASTQNRGEHADFRAHLLGRIAYVTMLNPGRGAKLRALFDGIEWPSP